MIRTSDVQAANGMMRSTTAEKTCILELGTFLKVKLVHDLTSIFLPCRCCTEVGYTCSVLVVTVV